MSGYASVGRSISTGSQTSPAVALLFRDYLPAHAEVAAEYAMVKRGLALRCRDDRRAYVDAKVPFLWRSSARQTSGPKPRDGYPAPATPEHTQARPGRPHRPRPFGPSDPDQAACQWVPGAHLRRREVVAFVRWSADRRLGSPVVELSTVTGEPCLHVGPSDYAQ